MTLQNLYGKVLQGWQRELTDNGVPYYVSSLHASSQWYHPEYVLLLQRIIQGHRDTRYTAYRTAQKLASLQDALAVGSLSLQSLVSACAAVGLSGTDTNDDHVTLEVVEALLLSLYGEDGAGGGLRTRDSTTSGGRGAPGHDTLLAKKKERIEKTRAAGAVKFSSLGAVEGRNDPVVQQGGELVSRVEKGQSSKKEVAEETTETINKSVRVELLINLLLNLFDQSRQGLLPVLGVKLVLLVLCGSGAALQHKHAYLQAQLSDYSSAVPRSSVRRALLLLARLPELLGEELWFGRQLVGAALKGCFPPGRADGVGLAPAELRHWLRRDPQTLVWWSTLYRLRHASSVQHVGAECSACHVSAPRGLLYECLRCVSYSLCQSCFLSGRGSADHDPSHPLQELCAPLTPAQRGREVLSRLGDKLRLSGPPKQRYLPLEAADHSDGDSTLRAAQVDQDTTVTNDALLSRTVLLDQTLGGAAVEECELRISPGPGEQGRERLPLEPLRATGVHLLSISPPAGCYSNDKQRLGPLKGTYKQTPEEAQGKHPCLNNCKDDFLPPQGIPKKKKKGFMNILFRGGKGSKNDKKSKSDNKENIGLADAEDGGKGGFTRASSRSRSFGADGASRVLPGDGGLRYGSCRMNQPWRRPPDAARAPPPRTAALPDDSLLRVQRQNTSNSRHQQLLRGRDGAVASGGAAVEHDTRQQLERVISQLQYGYSALHDVSLSGPRSAAVVRDHTAQLLQQVAALKLLLQSLNGSVGVVPPRPRSVLPSQLLHAASFESSTPIAGGALRPAPQATPLTAAAPPTLTKTGQLFRPPFRTAGAQSSLPRAAADGREKECLERLCEEGASPVRKGDRRGSGSSGVCWSSLSPITCNSQQSSRLLDDTAVLDNRQNHKVENPVFEGESSEGVFREPCAPRTAPPHPQPTCPPAQAPASPASRSRLPSFTEVNFSDLTDASSRARESRLADRYSEHCERALATCGPRGGDATFAGGEDTPADTNCLELQVELEEILHQLDVMFPKATDKQDEECAGVVCAAQELGDCLAEYVNAVPPPPPATAAAGATTR